MLLIGFTFSFVDRQVLNLLVEPIQQDLNLTDTQISLLQGLAFVVTYVALSVPIGRMVDRFNRLRIMIGGILVWSVTTIACGLSRNFTQLMFARMGVGAGEATLTPAAWSVLADYFHPDRLSRPMSVYLMGPYIGAGIAMIAGAQVLDWTRTVEQISLPLVGDLAPWQFTFIAVGLPGAVIALLFATLREPERRGRAEPGVVPAWSVVIAYLRQNWRLYLPLHIGIPFIVVMLYGLQSWVPTILVRVFEMDLADAGRQYGVVALLAGSAGVLTGPVAERFLRRRGDTVAPLRVAMIGALSATACLTALPFCTSAGTALTVIAGASFSVTLPLALASTVMQTVTPNEMRGVVNGLYVVTTNVLGLALGPTLVAATTDFIFDDPQAVARSLAVVSLIVGPAAVLVIWTGFSAYRGASKG